MRKLIFTMIFSLLTGSAYANWVGPKQVLSGNWGKTVGDFGLVKANPVDGFPEDFLVTSGGDIIIADQMNKRIEVFQNGEISVIVPKDLKISWVPETWPSAKSITYFENYVYDTSYEPVQAYNYNGSLAFTFNVGDIYFKFRDSEGNLYFFGNNNKYFKYSSMGELLATYDQRPLALGTKSSRRRAGSANKYDTTVRYEDITYHMILDDDYDNYVRDQNNFLYFYDSYTTQDPVGNDSTIAWFVVKYDPCGKKIAKLLLPVSEYEPLTQEELSLPVSIRPKVRNEYGPPVIGPDGSVYCWKRTPDSYSILKWTWVDDPRSQMRGGFNLQVHHVP